MTKRSQSLFLIVLCENLPNNLKQILTPLFSANRPGLDQGDPGQLSLLSCTTLTVENQPMFDILHSDFVILCSIGTLYFRNKL